MNIGYAASSSVFDPILLHLTAQTACCACGGSENTSQGIAAVEHEYVLHLQRSHPEECVIGVEDVKTSSGSWRGAGMLNTTEWDLTELGRSAIESRCLPTSMQGFIASECIQHEKQIESYAARLAVDDFITRRPNGSDRMTRNISWIVGNCEAQEYDLSLFDSFVRSADTVQIRLGDNLQWTSVALPRIDRRHVALMFNANEMIGGRGAIQSSVTGDILARLEIDAETAWPIGILEPLVCSDWLCEITHGTNCLENSVEVLDCAGLTNGTNPLGRHGQCQTSQKSPRFCVARDDYIQLHDAWGDGWEGGYLVCFAHNVTINASVISRTLSLRSHMCQLADM